MSEWKPAKLGDIAEMCLGKMLDKEKNKGVLQPYLANLNVRWGGFELSNLSTMRFEESESERYGLRSGDLVICEGGEPGRCAIWRDEVPEMKIQKAIHRLRTNKNYSNEFVYYQFLLAGRNGELAKHFNGSTIKHLTGYSLKQVEFKFPPLAEQNRIAAVLSALDAKIALNHRINVELEGMAKLLYDYWFVQYDFPLSAAQAAALGKPRLTGQPYRSSGGPMVFDPQLKREVPEGWKVGNISELCLLNHRTWPNKDHPGEVIYLDLANAKNGEILSVQNFAWDEAPSRARRILTPGDTIFGTVRPGNRSFALVPKSEEVLTGSTGFAVLTPKSAIYREFNYLSLTSESNINRLTTVASGAAYPAVNPEVVAAQTLALPNAELIKQFHQTTAAFFDLIERHRAQNQELTTLRDWLLPMLMNGQVRVSA